MPMMYIPRARCAKCKKDIVLQRKHQGNDRWLVAECHGQVAHVAFAESPDERVNVFIPPPGRGRKKAKR